MAAPPRRITRADLESKLREVRGEVEEKGEAAKSTGLTVALVGVVALVGMAFLLGSAPASCRSLTPCTSGPRPDRQGQPENLG